MGSIKKALETRKKKPAQTDVDYKQLRGSSTSRQQLRKEYKRTKSNHTQLNDEIPDIPESQNLSEESDVDEVPVNAEEMTEEMTEEMADKGGLGCKAKGCTQKSFE